MTDSRKIPWSVSLWLVLTASSIWAGGCTAPMKVDPVYFPAPPAPPHAVYLKSFNSLSDLVPPRFSWIDVLRGGALSPHVGRPAGIAFHDGHLYVCDTLINGVHDWDLTTGDARRLGLDGDVRLAKPVDVAVDDQGTVYVADTERAEVVAFEAGGAAIRRFKPAEDESFKPAAVAVNGADLYVADTAAHVIHVFSTTDGNLRNSFGAVGSEPGKFYYPMGVAVGPNDRLFVSDMMNSRVQVFDDRHQATLAMGQPGNRYGDMGKPKRLAVGPDGVVFVADSEFGHVHLFNDQGQLLMLLGGPEDGPGGTPMPAGLAVAPMLPPPLAELVPADFHAHYFVFVTNTVGTRRISLYAIGTAR